MMMMMVPITTLVLAFSSLIGVSQASTTIRPLNRLVSARLTRRSNPYARSAHHSHYRSSGLEDPFECPSDDERDLNEVKECSSTVVKSLARGAVLRVASDMSGGIPFEAVKVRVAATGEGPVMAVGNIIEESGIRGLWAGCSTRVVEGSLLGAIFMLGSTFTKKRILGLGGSPMVAALAGGLVGGVAQASVMTPAGLIFTSLNLNKNKRGHENDTALSVARRIIRENGIRGMFYGGGPMALRQASNWASRSCFTEIARSTLGLSKYGIAGEIGSGVMGGLGSCWNTPIETIRVVTQRDVSEGLPPKAMPEYWDEIVDEQGYAGLFRGVSPRALQAIWQTVFMVVVPNVLGF